MSSAKIVSLKATPSEASHLCFEVGGIVGELHTQLGARVRAFDFAAFNALLGSIPTIPGHPARLLYDFLQIQDYVKKYNLVALRSESAKTALNKAINTRANAFYAKYADAPTIIARMHEDYSPSRPGSKPNRLDVLRSMSQDQMEKLRDAYLQDNRTDVVKGTDSVVDSTSSIQGDSVTSGWSGAKGVNYMNYAPGTWKLPPKGAVSSTLKGNGGSVAVTEQLGRSEQNSVSKGIVSEHQNIGNTDYGYRIPYLENFAQYHRAQISLIDEGFAQFMAAQNLPYLAAVFQNELQSIDSDVFRLQIAYLNTILMSPLGGTVTGLYKNLGDAVNAGEPVARVENNAEVFLLGALVYRGPISIGSNVAVSTTLFGLPGPPTAIQGRVVGVRGQHKEDHWELIARCNNLDSGGKQVFPIGYQFDCDETTVNIT